LGDSLEQYQRISCQVFKHIGKMPDALRRPAATLGGAKENAMGSRVRRMRSIL
jgi:hypothetical protein